MSGQALITDAQRKLQSEDRPKNVRLLALQAMNYLPAKKVQPILDGLRNGMTRRQAAGLAGMSLAEFNFCMQLGEQGHPAWIEFVDAVRIADAESLQPTMTKLQEQAEEGNEHARSMYLKSKDPDFRDPKEPSPNTGVNVGGFTININKKFDREEPTNVVDTTFEEVE